MLNVTPVAALRDNYVWLLQDAKSPAVAIVDPGEAGRVLEFLAARRLEPVAILVTHHHWDHTNGIEDLLQRYPGTPVYGPAKERIPARTHPLGEGSQVQFPEINLELEVFEVPGHTAGAVAYYGHGMLFSGDTLFTAGCGRLFEGTAEQMHASLSKLASLPDSTLLYCGHEYTLANLEFAAKVEPGNADINNRIEETQALRKRGLPTVPAMLVHERRTNPFLRCGQASVKEAAERWSDAALHNEIEVFAALRRWKDGH